jgi:hypothetical protein
MDRADEYYLEARDAVLTAVRGHATRGRVTVRAADGTEFGLNWATLLRVYLLMIWRRAPGQPKPTTFNFQRGGRVDVGGDRKVPLGEALAAGHDPWASREELLELAAQISGAVPARCGRRARKVVLPDVR